MRRAIVLLACLVVLAACTSLVQERKQPVAFDPAEHAAFAAEGSGVISGQAVLKTPEGGRWYGSGSKVLLLPSTRYSRNWLSQGLEDGSLKRTIVEVTDPNLQPFARTVLADEQGRFRFERVPRGNFLVICPIFRRIPGIPVPLGATGSSQVRLGDAEIVETQVDRRLEELLGRGGDPRLETPGSRKPHAATPSATR